TFRRSAKPQSRCSTRRESKASTRIRRHLSFRSSTSLARPLAAGVMTSIGNGSGGIVGDLKFKYADVVVGLCPEDRVDELEEEFHNVKFISPRWGLDRIIEHLRD